MTNPTIKVYNPGTGALIGEVPEASVDDVATVVAQGLRGQAAMAATPAHRRQAMLFKLADLMECDAEALAQLDAAENGKPIQQTRGEVEAAIRIFRGYAAEATRILGRQFPMDAVPGAENHFAVTIREPLGLVAALIPFNYPVELYSHKAAAALAAGNAVITKPPTRCPLALFKIHEYYAEAGFPPYAHQVIVGNREVVAAIADHPDIAAVTITGGTEAGRNVAERCARRFAKVFLELGGNDPLIVLNDADLDKAVDAIVYGRLARGNGQICCAVKRVYATTGIYDRLAERLVEKTRQLIVGDQLDEATDVGPLIAEADAVKVEEAINQLVAEGAELLIGGTRQGAFVTPAVLYKVPATSPTIAEEVFGPVAPLVEVDNVEQAIELANDSPYGLQAAIFTSDINRALKAATKLNAGSVMINGTTAMRAENLPFGGVGETGGYREGIHDTVLDFTRQKTIVVIGALA
ncbi:MAG: aldehyde dehydrogenase family protein [Propionibacteriaceae bacterium]|jgi:lactaldehyde dehydrogenase|nr:aldehyde dehydrogenase family protein [Propionibacteriaceae bacterium]